MFVFCDMNKELKAFLKQTGATIRTARMDHKLSQEELAVITEMSRSAISEIEHGAPITLTTLFRLLKPLSLELDIHA